MVLDDDVAVGWDQVLLNCFLALGDLFLHLFNFIFLELLSMLPVSSLKGANEIHSFHGFVNDFQRELGFLLTQVFVVVDQCNLLVVACLEFFDTLFLNRQVFEHLRVLRYNLLVG